MKFLDLRQFGYLCAITVTLILPRPCSAFCNPEPGESSTCVHRVELNPQRTSIVEVSHRSIEDIRRILRHAGLLPEIGNVLIALDKMDRLWTSLDPILFRYDVGVGSVAPNSDCELYHNFTKLGEWLVTGDCTITAKIILQYTDVFVDMQEKAKSMGWDSAGWSDDGLVELYTSITAYFNTAISYAFHGLKGPGHAVKSLADRDTRKGTGELWTWGQSAWPWGVSEEGVVFPAGGIVEYVAGSEDTWESIAASFTGDPNSAQAAIELNPGYRSNQSLGTGDEVYVPLEIPEWLEVEVEKRSAKDIAQDVYGDHSFAEIVTRTCRLGSTAMVRKCVLPVFYDVSAVYEAFFAR